MCYQNSGRWGFIFINFTQNTMKPTLWTCRFRTLLPQESFLLLLFFAFVTFILISPLEIPYSPLSVLNICRLYPRHFTSLPSFSPYSGQSQILNIGLIPFSTGSALLFTIAIADFYPAIAFSGFLFIFSSS